MEPPVSPTGTPALGDVRILQVQPRKGKYEENLRHIGDLFAQIASGDESPDLVVLPEAATTGYFLEGAVYDLALPATRFARDLAQTWIDRTGGKPVDLTCGFYENADGTYYNSAIFLRIDGKAHEIVHVHRKMFLPTYGVFDEERFLSRGRRLSVFDTRLGRAALLICEDSWHAIMPTIAAVKGARLIIVPSASPGRGIEGTHELTSITRWRELLTSIAAEHGVYVVYAGLTGFEGGKGMTGSSAIIDPWGRMQVEAPDIGECVLRGFVDPREGDMARATLPLLGDLNAVLPDLLLDEELPLPKARS
ncbi:MAG TPA: nitrilase-related carbon-nitrogen hydrolase [Candidatus Aquilonibacter sp.]|nr:nitrilase-related carbon-nitrogen hydrolase [Candidatus Aquilonibacter sp.]